MADFSTWSRENLERLAQDLLAENNRLRDDVALLLDAWRTEVYNAELLRVAQPGQSSRPGTEGS